MTQLTDLIDGEGYVKQPGQWRRQGENGPPLVSDPDGVAVKSGARAGQVKLRTYSRPSNFGKQVENTYNLEKWSERQVARGLALAVVEDDVWDPFRMLANGDPDDPAWKKEADGAVVQAKRLAGAMTAADRGTHGHLLTEDHDLDRSIVTRLEAGEDLGLSPALQRAVVEAWQALIDEHFEVLAVEAPVVFDEWRVAGTLDRVVRLKYDLTFDLADDSVLTIPAGTVLVLDIKTGGLKTDRNGLPLYWHSYAVQIAAYALGQPYDVDTEKREEWAHQPSTEHAVIAHIDIAGALDTDVVTAQLIYVDLTAGRYAGELVCHAKGWQKRDDIFSPAGSYLVARTVATPTASPAGDGIALTSPAAIDPVGPSEPCTAVSAIQEVPTPRIAPDGDSSPTCAPSLSRDAVLARAKRLIDAGHGLALAQVWPEDVPGFKSDHQHTAVELRAVYEAICEVEDEHQMSPGWVDADCTQETKPSWISGNIQTMTDPYEAAAKKKMETTGSTPSPDTAATAVVSPVTSPSVSEIDEGPLVDAATYDALKAAYRNLTDDHRQVLEQITTQAKAAGLPISLSQLHSRRRWEIARALVVWEHYWSEDVIRDLLGEVIDSDIPRHPSTPLGAVFGALTIDEAQRLAAMADRLNDGASLEYVDSCWRVVAP